LHRTFSKPGKVAPPVEHGQVSFDDLFEDVILMRWLREKLGHDSVSLWRGQGLESAEASRMAW